MTDSFYNNRPHELSEETDLFGTYDKAEVIRKSLDENVNLYTQNNMVALYGRWGSGKTSIMKYIGKHTQKYGSILFETWRYENDTDLALSLFEAIACEIEKSQGENIQKIVEDVRIYARAVLGLGKNLLRNIKISLLDMNCDVSQAIKDTEKEIDDKIIKRSYYFKIEKFKEKFKKLVDEYCKKERKKLLVFIDDLDRCESENILNLLACIKHFFTNSDEVVYLCGVDKEAVKKAINAKYKDLIKADEYLEKIFDISFNVPEQYNITNLIKDYFSKIETLLPIDEKDKKIRIVKKFFQDIQFTNPRKVKKVLNKSLLQYKLRSDELNPNNIIYMISMLYVIILYEFYKDIFYLMYNYDEKLEKCKRLFDLSIEMEIDKKGNKLSMDLYIKRDYNSIIEFDFVHHLIEKKNKDNSIVPCLFDVLILFMPTDVRSIEPLKGYKGRTHNILEVLEEFTAQFKITNQKILYGFMKFILHLYELQLREEERFTIIELFKDAILYF